MLMYYRLYYNTRRAVKLVSWFNTYETHGRRV